MDGSDVDMPSTQLSALEISRPLALRDPRRCIFGKGAGRLVRRRLFGEDMVSGSCSNPVALHAS